MADNIDDLDAFFSEVSAVEAEAKKEDTQDTKSKDQHVDDDEQAPPAKKIKLNNNDKPKPRRPMGVVVASSSQVKTVVPAITTTPAAVHTNQAPSPQRPIQPSLLSGPQPPTSTTATKQHNYTKRSAAGKTWVDPTLDEWPENDYRIFVGNLPKEIADDALLDHFLTRYPSVARAKIVRDANGISKGYGFVSFLEPMECARAIREMDQTWLSSRPIRVKRSDWKDRDLKQVSKKKKKATRTKRKMGF